MDLFHNGVFKVMAISYLAGFLIFAAGIFLGYSLLLQAAAVVLVVAAFLYNLNILKLLRHKPAHV